MRVFPDIASAADALYNAGGRGRSPALRNQRQHSLSTVMPELVSLILGTFFGALLGIPAGLAVNHFWRNRVDATHREQLRAAILIAVKSNADHVKVIEEWTQNRGGWPYFNVDLSILESTASLKYEVLNDFGLCQEVDHLRFELSHLARKVDRLLDLEFNPSAKFATSGPAGSAYNELRPLLIKAIGVHLAPISKRIEELIPRLQPIA